MVYRIALIDKKANAEISLAKLAQIWGLEHDDKSNFSLVLTQYLALQQTNKLQMKPIYVDFTSDQLTYRQHHITIRKEILVRAVGVAKNYRPTVLDVTAGLGRDAFILACAGCHVQMLERHPVIAALLNDGLRRGYEDKRIGNWLSKRLILLGCTNFTQYVQHINTPDVVYIDPMFPPHKKHALTKKDLQILQQIVGYDEDADQLLEPALALAKKRIVIKRPITAPPLSGKAPHATLRSRYCRFDLYLPSRI